MAIFAFPSRMAWAILAVFGVAAYGALLMMGVAIRIESLLLPLTAISSCLAISAFYTHVRPDRRLAVMAAGTAFILTFGATAGPLTYPAASIGLPLRDDLFIAFERSIGIDWPSLADALTPMPTANLLWAIIYMSSLPQIAVAVLALGFTDRHERLASYLWLLVTSIVCTIVLFVLAPAAGRCRASRSTPTFTRASDQAGSPSSRISKRCVRGGSRCSIWPNWKASSASHPSIRCWRS